MTNKERVAVLAIYISVLGFVFVAALKPVMISYVTKQGNSFSSVTYQEHRIQVQSLNIVSDESSSKVVTMLSEVLDISKEDILLSLKGGTKPNELLLNSGILLSDLSEEYSFDIVGTNLIRFRA